MAMDEQGSYYVEHVVRGQWSALERENIMKETAIQDAQRYGRVRFEEGQLIVEDPGPAIWVEQEPGSGGKESAEATIRNLSGFVVRPDRPTGDKAVRAEPFAAQAEAGNVRLVRGRWDMRAYIEELCLFPRSADKDQVDASSGAFNKLAWGRMPVVDRPIVLNDFDRARESSRVGAEADMDSDTFTFNGVEIDLAEPEGHWWDG
jgi:predicted phage terminase large subunit-like protein